MIFSLGVVLVASGEAVTMRQNVQRAQRFDRVDAMVWSGKQILSRVHVQGLVVESMYLGVSPVVSANNGVAFPLVSLVGEGIALREGTVAQVGHTVSVTVRNLGVIDLHVAFSFIGPVAP